MMILMTMLLGMLVVAGVSLVIAFICSAIKLWRSEPEFKPMFYIVPGALLLFYVVGWLVTKFYWNI